MDRPKFEGKFYETYYFCNVVDNVLRDPAPYIRNLNDFYGDGRIASFASPFPRYSAFHQFIEFLVDDLIYEQLDAVDLEERKRWLRDFERIPAALDPDPRVLPLDAALDFYGIKHVSFVDWLKENSSSFQSATEDDASEYYSELRSDGTMDTLLQRAVDEVFFVTFQNRSLLLRFHDLMARMMSDCDTSEIEADCGKLFSKTGILKRVGIPAWVQRAVFYRDRGLCVVCHRDLSGTICIGNKENFDHIVPLAQSGLNDVTNIQLLCFECNSKKRHHTAQTSDFYEHWYEMKEPFRRR